MDLKKRIEEIALDLCGISSVTGTKEEKDGAIWIHENLKKLDYFNNNPDNLIFIDDESGGYGVIALVESHGPEVDTVGLTGHFDVVSASVYGDLMPLAFDPAKLTEEMKLRDLPDAVREDIDDGWVFGRGLADMKCGLSVELGLLEKWAEEGAPCNVLFLAVSDEENLSAGMRSSLSEVAKLVVDRGLKMTAWVNGEPTVGSRGSQWPVHRGTVGKAMGFVLSVGVGSHVGEFFNGISAVQIAGQINGVLEGSEESSDSVAGKDQRLPPAACLGFYPVRDGYSVTLYDKVMARYNLLYCDRDGEDLISLLRSSARAGLERAIEMTKKSALSLGRSFEFTSGRVIDYVDLRKKALKINPDLDAYLSSLKRQGDLMDCAESEVLEVLRLSGIEGPVAIVGFLPPWYPARVSSDHPSEVVLDRALKDVFDLARLRGYEPVIETLFEGICDLSYTGPYLDDKMVLSMSNNMAGWGNLYSLPVDDMACIGAPVCNIGPFGLDIHKFTERLEPRFAFTVLPELMEKLVKSLAEKNR